MNGHFLPGPEFPFYFCTTFVVTTMDYFRRQVFYCKPSSLWLRSERGLQLCEELQPQPDICHSSDSSVQRSLVVSA